MLEIIDRLYAAAMQAGGETEIMNVVRQTIGAEHVVAQDMSLACDRATWHCDRLSGGPIADVSPDMQGAYRAMLAQLPLAEPIRSSALIDPAEFRRTAFYNDVLKPLDGGLALNIRMRTEAGDLALIVCRSLATGRDFNDREMAMAAAIAPHAARALRMRGLFVAAESRSRAEREILDSVDEGIIVLDEDGRAAFVNRQARMTLDAGFGPVMAGDGLDGGDSDLGGELARAIAAHYAAFRRNRPPPADTTIRLLRRAPAPPLSIKLNGVRSSDGLPTERFRLLVRFRDPLAEAVDRRAHMRQVFGLTQREFDVAESICSGATVAEAAARLNLSVGTVRQYLVRIFEKTGARRQMELLRLLH